MRVFDKRIAKECARCERNELHAEGDYLCDKCRFISDHQFRRDGHTVSFYVGHVGKVGVNVECPYSAEDSSADCYIGGHYEWDHCLVAHEMAECEEAMELLTDPYGGDYEISSANIPIEWYYNSGQDRYGEWDCEFGWRIADDFETPPPAQITSDGTTTSLQASGTRTQKSSRGLVPLLVR